MENTRTLADMLNEPKPQYRPLEVIADEMEAIERQIDELGRMRDVLMNEHEETAEAMGLRIKLI